MLAAPLAARSRNAADQIDAGGDAGDVVVSEFLEHAIELGVELYPAQEEAVLEVALGRHVIVNTPTGSGKSMVASAAHFAALSTGRRSWYTAPIKALVSEKFFALCREFGSDLVGMITGDAAVNPDAPIICCTAEILAHVALRDGVDADVDVAIVDEFHYYGDEQRGWAWQLPLLELTRTQFVLMSATLGDVEFFRGDLELRSGRTCSVVSSATRPVPLDFEYRTSTLHRSVEELLAAGKAPIYVVHFTQKDATDAAQGFVALDPLSKDEKAAVKEAIGGFRFDSPIGKDLKRFLTAGVGVHHAGLLPKYRLLVEKLAQDGLLKIICGTDTLGVGVNVPIRSVLFTKLCKYDGRSVRILTNRDFQQIAGRAGRKGFDDRGDVWVQAPEHVVENLIADAKAAAGGKKAKVKKKPPERGYAHWDEQVFEKLVAGRPESLRSHFRVDHQMVMSLLDRPVMPRPGGATEDGCAALRRLLRDNHETRRRQRGHVRRAIAIYRSLVEADILEFLDSPDEHGRRVRVTFDLQDEFALHQPLSLWALDAVARLRREMVDGGAQPDEIDTDVEYALDVVTIIEAVAENPGVVLAAQEDKVKSALMAEMKADHVEYEERMERLAEAEAPKPNKDWLYSTFNEFRATHPWVGGDTVKPKSVVRDLYERAMTFGEYVHEYRLKRSEGVLLRYLSDVYKGLIQNVPEAERTEALDDVVAWLGALVRQVDSSLIDEWERLVAPDDEVEAPVRPTTERTIFDDERALRVMVRNTVFDWVQRLARRERLDVPGAEGIDTAVALAPYWAEHDEILTGPAARSGERFVWDATEMKVTQILHDPDETNEWRIEAEVDRAASLEADRPVLTLRSIRRA